MKDSIEERAMNIANYIIEHNATVRRNAIVKMVLVLVNICVGMLISSNSERSDISHCIFRQHTY